MELLDYENKHIEFLEKNAQECTLFLKRDAAWPVSKAGTVALYGNGARNTIKGGTGSGDVASRFFVNFEEGLEKDGFKIISKSWIDQYCAIKKAGFKDYVKETKAEAKKNGYMASVYSMGLFQIEPEYDLPLQTDADIAVYVLSRESGEGNDRQLVKGDIYLTDTEVRDILFLEKNYAHFMLVLNVGGVVDLSPVMSVRNILYISQLGVVTGDILGKILLGKANPSGKLSSTWARPEDYSAYDNFGDLDDVKYEEGIYVGYRYFDTVGKTPLFSFGHGLSYSDFTVDFVKAEIEKTIVRVEPVVKNVSAVPGKEVVQLYMSAPAGRLDQPYQSLAGFAKTNELAAGETETVSISFDLRDFASYDEGKEAYVLEAGEYILRLGNSSAENTAVAVIHNAAERTVKKCRNVMGEAGIQEKKIERRPDACDTAVLVELVLAEDAIAAETVKYKKDEYVDPSLEKLSDEELMLLTLGNHGKGIAAMVGGSCVHVVGGAGETKLGIPGVDKSLTMADGPAGLRLKTVYGVDKKGIYDVTMDPLMEKMLYFLPALSAPFIKPPKNRHGEMHYQYTTAIPIGTAIAQSFNAEFAEQLGDLVAEEMELFGVNLWLAPALNIHRNIRCGRNFEYFSEDPLVSGVFAAAITKGVQAHKGRGVTIKHFLANNQELNRNNGNCHITERTLREIYLRGFEYCIKEAEPASIMTSYNLINGVHTSENAKLIMGILRCELDYKGLVMTDWIASGRSFCKKAKYPAPYASNNILAGNDLTMPGAPADEKNIRKALKSGKLKRRDLLISASRIVRAIKELNR